MSKPPMTDKRLKEIRRIIRDRKASGWACHDVPMDLAVEILNELVRTRDFLKSVFVVVRMREEDEKCNEGEFVAVCRTLEDAAAVAAVVKPSGAGQVREVPL